MHFEKILNSVDVDRMRRSAVAVLGVGGAAGFTKNFARNGLGRLDVIDRDFVDASNIARQDYDSADVGRPKAEVLAETIRRINPDTDTRSHFLDFTQLSDAGIDELLGETNLLVVATDNHRAAARGNEVALRKGIPAIWIGLYAGGLGGEVAFWYPKLDACYHCLVQKRYEAQERAAAEGRSTRRATAAPSSTCPSSTRSPG